MTLQMLRCFVTVADTHNFAQAANQLHLTQPAVTHELKALEAELGLSLFDRTKRPAQLTSAGLSLYNDAKNILYHLSLSEEHLRDFSAFSDALYIGCNNAVRLPLLPAIFHEYYTQFPDIYLNTIELPDVQQTNIVSEPLDVAFLPKDLAEQQKNARYINLYTGSFYCILPEKHPLADKDRISSADLKGENLIMLDNTHCPPQAGRIQDQLRWDNSNAKFYLCSSSLYSVYMVAAGIGITVMPDFVCIPIDGIKMVPFETAEIPEFGLVTSSLHTEAKTENFVKIAKKIYRNNNKNA